jgi:hypothetical protein
MRRLSAFNSVSASCVVFPSNVLQRTVEKFWKKKWIVTGKSFKDTYPVEAQSLETQLAKLFAEARESRDIWCEKLLDRYPTRKEWEHNPDRSKFIHDLFEQAGFRVRYTQGDLPGWIVKE